MKRYMWPVRVLLLAGAWLVLPPLPTVHAQVGGMTCIECHANPLAGGFHGGFRDLGALTDAEMEVVCITCHDGSYTNPQGVAAPEAAVHQNKNPGAGRDEYGDFKATCLDCHTTHTNLLAGDGTTSTVTISTPSPDPNVDESHDVESTTSFFLLGETSVTASSVVITDDLGAAFTEDVDFEVRTLGNQDPATSDGDPRRINILSGGAIEALAPTTVFAGYEFAGNQQLLGREVVEASSTDRLARIRKPNIVDPNGDDGGTGRTRFEEDFQNGTECSSGIPDDPACLPDDVRELVFHDQITENATNWTPTIIGFGPPVVTSGPRNGACNSCHTRTSHHRRNDLNEFGGGDDHTHNVDKACDQCHSHSAGWVNKGG